MVKVFFRPLKEIIIHEAIEHTLNDLVRYRVLGVRIDSMAQPLVWAEGVVFSRRGMPPTEDVVRDQLQGIIHFSAIEWALMPKFRKELKSRGVKIPVVNGDDNPSLKEVARQLKKRHKKR